MPTKQRHETGLGGLIVVVLCPWKALAGLTAVAPTMDGAINSQPGSPRRSLAGCLAHGTMVARSACRLYLADAMRWFLITTTTRHHRIISNPPGSRLLKLG